MAFYFNQTNCTGCKACQIACKDAYDLPVGVFFRHVRSFETGSYPKPNRYHYSHTCNHCATPACVAFCPENSLFIADDGTVQQDQDLCTGCKKCIDACPYGVPQYLEDKNIVTKCDSCASYRAAGEPPACVAACIMRVLEFGSSDELKSKHAGEKLVIDFPFLPSSSTTNPSTLVKGRNCAFEANYKEHLEV